jgi:hypothetical protein
MNSLASNVHVLNDLNRAERPAQQATSPASLASVIASLFSAAGRDRLAAGTVGDAADAAYGWGL